MTTTTEAIENAARLLHRAEAQTGRGVGATAIIQLDSAWTDLAAVLSEEGARA